MSKYQLTETEIKRAALLATYLQILDHTKKCLECRHKMEQILQHAIETGDYTIGVKKKGNN